MNEGHTEKAVKKAPPFLFLSLTLHSTIVERLPAIFIPLCRHVRRMTVKKISLEEWNPKHCCHISAVKWPQDWPLVRFMFLPLPPSLCLLKLRRLPPPTQRVSGRSSKVTSTIKFLTPSLPIYFLPRRAVESLLPVQWTGKCVLRPIVREKELNAKYHQQQRTLGEACVCNKHHANCFFGFHIKFFPTMAWFMGSGATLCNPGVLRDKPSKEAWVLLVDEHKQDLRLSFFFLSIRDIMGKSYMVIELFANVPAISKPSCFTEMRQRATFSDV